LLADQIGEKGNFCVFAQKRPNQAIQVQENSDFGDRVYDLTDHHHDRRINGKETAAKETEDSIQDGKHCATRPIQEHTQDSQNDRLHEVKPEEARVRAFSVENDV
jgi:hypothetical protein